MRERGRRKMKAVAEGAPPATIATVDSSTIGTELVVFICACVSRAPLVA